MNQLSKEDLKALALNSGNPAVSLYMPTHRMGDTKQNSIRLKNLLREAEKQVIEFGIRAPDAHEYLAPVRQLIGDSLFWQNQDDGLALFLAPDEFRSYQVPFSFPELIVTADHFHVKPLIPLLSEDWFFYVLALSQKQVRLLQCTRYQAQDITPEDIPSSLEESLQHDHLEKQLQFRTQQPGGPALYHGHGVKKDLDKVNILKYCQRIDERIKNQLKDGKAPLIISAVEFLSPIYREANTYPHLLEKSISGNPDELNEKELQSRALTIVQSYFERDQNQAREQFLEAATKGLATSDVNEAVLAAWDGRISTLFVARDIQLWGRFDPEERTVSLDKEKVTGTKDLLDLAAIHTLIKDGSVYVVESDRVPGKTPLAALFRY